jgi:hypothetical protein
MDGAGRAAERSTRRWPPRVDDGTFTDRCVVKFSAVITVSSLGPRGIAGDLDEKETSNE